MQRLPDHMRAMLAARNPSDNWIKGVGKMTNYTETENKDCKGLVLYSMQVAMKIKEDYNLSVDTMPQHWLYEMIHDYYTDKYPVYDTAFMIASKYQAGDTDTEH